MQKQLKSPKPRSNKHFEKKVFNYDGPGEKLTSDRYYSLSNAWMLNDPCCQGHDKTIQKELPYTQPPIPYGNKNWSPKAAIFSSIQEIYVFFKFDGPGEKLTSDRYYSLSNAWMLNDPCCQGHDKTIHKSCCSCPIGLASWFIYSFNCITYTLCLIYVNLFC